MMQNFAPSTHVDVHNVNIETCDFDLHGIVGIRLVGAKPGDVAAVRRQLGLIQTTLARDPDIIIRFVNQLRVSPIHYIGVEDAGFTDDAFLILRGKYEASIKVQIPFDRIGSSRCEIVCESGVPAVPLLIAIINLTALSKGYLPLHASALLYNDTGILLTGWSKGGKTETLLAFAANGARYVGDEWIYLSSDGQRMYGIPEPTRIWYWHLQEMKQYQAMVKRSDLLRLRALHLLAKTLESFEHGPVRQIGFLRLTKRMTALVKRQLYVQLPPEKLFGQKADVVDVRPEKIFFVVSHDRSEVTVRSVDPKEIAERIVFSLQEERMEFMSYYFKYRFAFPACANSLIDNVEEVERKLALGVVAGKEAYAIDHPYPFAISSIFDTIRPYCA